MKISVVSVFYNRGNIVKESIESLLRQDYKDIEIILVDDGSTDNTYEELNKYSHLENVKVLTHENMGFVRSIIKAIELTQGKYIAIHGAGDISSKDRLSKQIALFESNPELGIVGCHYRNVDEETGQEKIEKPSAILPKEACGKGFQFSQGELMYRKKAYMQVGGYRDWFYVGQGTDLWRRIILRGWGAGVVPEVLYTRFVRQDGVSTNYIKLAERQVLLAISESDVNTDGFSDFIDSKGVVGLLLHQKNNLVLAAVIKSSIKLSGWGEKSYARLFGRLAVRINLLALPILLLIEFPIICRFFMKTWAKGSLVFHKS